MPCSPSRICSSSCPGRRFLATGFIALLAGAAVATLGQAVRVATIGLEYIIRGGQNRQVYAENLVTEGVVSPLPQSNVCGQSFHSVGLRAGVEFWVCLLVAAPLFWLIYSSIVSAEEEFLRGKFGAAFVAYCQHVPRWIPRLRGLVQAFTGAQFHWRRVIVKEYGTPHGWIAALCVLGLVDLWREDRLHTGSLAATVLIAILVVTTVLRYWVRALKKGRRLIAD